MDQHLISILKESGFHGDCIAELDKADVRLADQPIWQECLAISPMDASVEPLSIKETHPRIAESTGINERLLDLLHLCLYLPPLEKLYRERGIDRTYFIGVARDLKVKSDECKAVWGHWGTATFAWHIPFYRLQRYALGRLQFEDRAYPDGDIDVAGMHVAHGDVIRGIHIPSGVPLTRESCIDSLKKAYAFYSCTHEKPLIVHCSSWLLSPDHRQMLPSSSNIVRFIDMFCPTGVSEQEEFGTAWRVFGSAAYTKPVSEWPTDTSFRRAYVNWLLAGKKTHSGNGILVFDGEKLLTERA